MIAQQLTTAKQATRNGEIWTSEELEMLTAFEGEALEELALALGRTYYSVACMRWAIARGKVAASTTKIMAQREERKPCPTCFVITACDC